MGSQATEVVALEPSTEIVFAEQGQTQGNGSWPVDKPEMTQQVEEVVDELREEGDIFSSESGLIDDDFKLKMDVSLVIMILQNILLQVSEITMFVLELCMLKNKHEDDVLLSCILIECLCRAFRRHSYVLRLGYWYPNGCISRNTSSRSEDRSR